MSALKNKNLILIVLISSFSICTLSKSLDEEVVVGMTIKSVCKNFSLKFSDRYEDPCHGYVQYNEDNKRIMLWNRDESIFLVFSNVPSSAFNRRGRLNFKKIGENSKLLLITSSGKEGLFFINNVLD
tara:strand:+ start:102 stop:482 length:381 start_codon:yes stop_codon:yes gene_type:complete